MRGGENIVLPTEKYLTSRHRRMVTTLTRGLLKESSHQDRSHCLNRIFQRQKLRGMRPRHSKETNNRASQTLQRKSQI